MATSSTNKPAVSTADGKCIWQKQEATLFVAEIKNDSSLIKLLQQHGQFDCQESEATMATFSSTKQVEFHDPQKITTTVLLARASPSVSHVLGGLNVDAHFFGPKMNLPIYQLIKLK
jgi:hypothetical protein